MIKEPADHNIFSSEEEEEVKGDVDGNLKDLAKNLKKVRRKKIGGERTGSTKHLPLKK